MIILHVFRAPLGGLFRHVVDLVRGQAARGHEVGIVADSLTGNARSKEMFATLAPVLALGLMFTPMPREISTLDVAAVAHVGKRIRRTRADVVHGHGAKGGAYARLAYAGRPIVRAYTPHGGSLLLDHSTLRGRAYLTMERALMRRGNLYLFESAFSGQAFHDKVGTPPGVARVVHNGVSPAEFAPVTPAAAATDIVYVGELRPVKGVDVLLEAIAELRRNGRAVTATLVGDGPDREALMAQAARLSLGAAVRFVQPTPMRQALSFGRIAVMPSRAESLPYVVLETAAAGRPLVTTNVGGIPEIYGPLSSSLIPPDDVRAVADAVRRFLDDPSASEAVTQQLRRRVADQFSLDAMVDGVLAGYREAHEMAIVSSGGALARAG